MSRPRTRTRRWRARGRERAVDENAARGEQRDVRELRANTRADAARARRNSLDAGSTNSSPVHPAKRAEGPQSARVPGLLFVVWSREHEYEQSCLCLEVHRTTPKSRRYGRGRNSEFH